jgi:ATP-dependent Clp protease ATP-binding subunit ClpA
MEDILMKSPFPATGEPSLSARHFTDAAQRVIEHIVDRAFDRGMISGELTEATGGMLALLSMLRWERKLGRAALEQIGVTLDTLAREVDSGIDEEGREARRPEGPCFETLPSGGRALLVDTQTPLRTLLDQAEHEALNLGHNWVGTEHLLLAVIHHACPRLQVTLRRHAITHDAVRQAVLNLLRA